MGWVRMIECLAPELSAPIVRELMGARLQGKPSTDVFRAGINYLKVSQFVQENVVKEESFHGNRRPLCSPLRPEIER